MRFLAGAAVTAAVCLALAGPAAAQQKGEEFSFYGLQFGMTREEVNGLMATNPSGLEVLKPGHGMAFLSLEYDYRGRLTEMKASYPRPAEAVAEEGLRRAIKDRFVQPTVTRHRNVAVNLDDYGNRAVLTLIFTSLDLREENVNHFRDEALKKME